MARLLARLAGTTPGQLAQRSVVENLARKLARVRQCQDGGAGGPAASRLSGQIAVAGLQGATREPVYCHLLTTRPELARIGAISRRYRAQQSLGDWLARKRLLERRVER